MTKQCKACGTAFQSHPKVPNQTYCSSPECQRERRRRWLEGKRQIDADYQGKALAKMNQLYSKLDQAKVADTDSVIVSIRLILGETSDMTNLVK